MVSVRGLNADGSYFHAVVRMSPSRQTATVVELFRGQYQGTGDKVTFIPEDGRAFVVPVERAIDRLVVNNVVHTRAPSWLALALDNNVANPRSR